MIFRQLYDSVSGTYSYLLASRAGGEARDRQVASLTAELAGLRQERDMLEHSNGVAVERIDAVIDALEHFRQGGDLADQLILARATRAGALPLLTFDQGFPAHEGVQRLGCPPQI